MSCFHLTLISLEIAIVKNTKQTRENIRAVKVLAHLLILLVVELQKLVLIVVNSKRKHYIMTARTLVLVKVQRRKRINL